MIQPAITQIRAGLIRLAVYTWGEPAPDRETLVLIHGYPDSAEVWTALASKLAQDFHVVAYDVRGTGASDAPRDRDYTFAALKQDLLAVIDHVSPDQPVHLVGHDWGALQGWEAVYDLAFETRLASYTTLAPSLDHVGWWFHRQLAQKSSAGYVQFTKQALSSSYMMLLQMPVIPELTWKLGLDQLWPRIVSRLERTAITPNPSQRKSAVNGINLYRANLTQPLISPLIRHTDLPIQMLIMAHDPFVPRHLCEGMEEWASNLEYRDIAAGHWGILSQPQAVAEVITDFVGKQASVA